MGTNSAYVHTFASDSRKKLPSPYRGGWISRLLGVKCSPRFFEQKSLSSHRFPKKSTHAPKIQSLLFSHSEFPGKNCEMTSGIPDFLHT